MKFKLAITATSLADAKVQVRNARAADPQLVPHIVVDFAEHVLTEGVFPTDGPLMIMAESDTYQDEGAQFRIFIGREDAIKARMDREGRARMDRQGGSAPGAAPAKADLPRVILDFTAGSRGEAISLIGPAHEADPVALPSIVCDDIQKNIEVAFTDDGPLHVKVTLEKTGYRTISVTRPTEGAFPNATKPNETPPAKQPEPELKTGEKAQE